MTYITNPKIKKCKNYLTDYEEAKYYNKYYNTSLKVIQKGSNSKGMCFNYATRNYNLKYSEDCFEYIKENYQEIDFVDIQKKDIVIFFEDLWNEEEENAEHFGVIKEKRETIGRTIIRSKWGTCGIFEGNINDLPEIYGHMVKFYRKK